MTLQLNSVVVLSVLDQAKKTDVNCTFDELVRRLCTMTEFNQHLCEKAVRNARDEGLIWIGRFQPVAITGHGKRRLIQLAMPASELSCQAASDRTLRV